MAGIAVWDLDPPVDGSRPKVSSRASQSAPD